MKKERLIKAALIIGAVAMLAACGKKDTASESTAASTADASDTELVKPESYGKVTKLGNYKNLEIPVEDTTVTDEEVQAEIENVKASNPIINEVKDRAAVAGDTVNIDYEGKMDGVAFDGGTGTAYDLKLGSGTFIEGFEDQLVGAKPGDTVEVEVTFPENYSSESLAGKPAVFTVKVNYIKDEQQVTELTDEWVSNVTNGECTKAADYEKYVRESLEKSKEENSKIQGQYAALTIVMESSEIVPSDEAVTYELNKMLQQYESMATMYGMDLDSLAQAYGLEDGDAFKEELRSYAYEAVSQKLIIDAIAEAENMKLDDADYKVLEENLGTDIDSLVENYGQEDIDQEALIYKVIGYLYDNSTKVVTDDEVTTEEATEETTEESTEEAAEETTKSAN